MVPLRQVMQMAEGQKSADLKHFMQSGPPPPANWNWRTVPNFPRKTRVLRISKCHLAERGGGRVHRVGAIRVQPVRQRDSMGPLYWPTVPARWCRPNGPLLVQPFTADGLIRQGHAA